MASSSGNNEFDIDSILSRLPSFSSPSSRPKEPPTKRKEVLPDREGFVTHVVKPYETLSAIALKHDLSVTELRTVNQLPHTAYLFPGQLLYVPDPESDRTNLKIAPSNDSRSHSLQSSINADPSKMEQTQLGPIISTEGVSKVGRSSFFEDSIPTPRRPQTLTDTLMIDEFMNETIVHVFGYYVTDGRGMVPGIIDVTREYLAFEPDPSPIVRELGREKLAFRLEMDDLLFPRTQAAPPDFKRKESLFFDEPGEYHRQGDLSVFPRRHKSMSGVDDLSEDATQDDVLARQKFQIHPADGTVVVDDAEATAAPLCYLRVRQQIVFGFKPTPDTVQDFWLATTVMRMDELYAMIFKHCRAKRDDEWEIIQVEKEHLPVKELQKLSRLPIPSFREGESSIIEQDDIALIQNDLPIMLQTADWLLLYSSVEHGISLNTLYRNCSEFEGPCVLIVQDRQRHVFGAFTADSWNLRGGYFGRGESFLFKLKPDLAVYHWSKQNHYIQMAKAEALAVGGGNGSFGLWIDEALNRGMSAKCSTFNNDCIASQEHFYINRVEVWGLSEI